MNLQPEFEAFERGWAAGANQLVYARLAADLDTPVSLMLKLGDARTDTFMLESVTGGEVRGRYSVVGMKPDLIWKCHGAQAQINRQARFDPQSFVAETAAPLDSLRALITESRVDGAAHFAGLWRTQIEFSAAADRLHEIVAEQDTVVQVECLAIKIARGFTNFEEFLDLGVADVEIAGGRPATQRPLADGECERIHHPDKRDDAAGFAVKADRLANAAYIAPIGADAAAARCKPDILVPCIDDALQAVVDTVQIAGNREPATGASVGQNGGCRHEPQFRDIIVQPLRVILIVGIGAGDAGKQILIAFARQ